MPDLSFLTDDARALEALLRILPMFAKALVILVAGFMLARLLARLARQTAERIGVEPTHLSKIERGGIYPPTEDTVRRLAADLGEDADLLLARAGLVASDILEVIAKRPTLFAEIIRGLGDVSDQELSALVHKVRNGVW